MNTREKFYSIFAIFVIAAVFITLLFYPETRQLKFLLPISFIGLVVNIIFMFIVLKDAFLRNFRTTGQKFLWIILILLCWPAVLVYLPRFGFKPRTSSH